MDVLFLLTRIALRFKSDAGQFVSLIYPLHRSLRELTFNAMSIFVFYFLFASDYKKWFSANIIESLVTVYLVLLYLVLYPRRVKIFF